MQKNQNQNDSILFDAPPSQHFFQEKPNQNNQRQDTHQSTDLDSPNKENESKNPQKNINNDNDINRDNNNYINYSKGNENRNVSNQEQNQNQSKGQSKNQNQHWNENKNNKDFNKNEKQIQRQKTSTASSGKRERVKLRTPNFLKVIQKQTNFPAVYVILPVLACGICVYFGFMEVFLTNLIGIIFPIYWSMRALDIDINSKDEEKQWYTYWLIFLGLLPIDMLFGRFLRLIPLLYFAKYVFLCWLFLPNFYGASYIHDRVIKKNLPQFEIVYRIDNASTQIKKEFKDFTTRLQHKMLESSTNEGREGLRKKKTRGSERKNKYENQNQQVELEQEHEGKAEVEETLRPEMTRDREGKGEAEGQQEQFQREKQGEFSYSQGKGTESGQAQSKGNADYNNKTKDKNNKNKNESEYQKENQETKQMKAESSKYPEQNKKQKQTNEAENKSNANQQSENRNRAETLEGSEAEKSDVSNAYENLITHINDIKSRSGKTKDLINSTIEKIWGRLHEESLLRKGNQEKNLFDNETDRRRFEELIREKNSADSDSFGVATNRGFPVEEEQTRKFFEKNNIETKENNEKNMKYKSNQVELEKDIDKDYPNKDENFKVKGERKIKESEEENAENKENIQTENIKSNRQNKKKETKEKDEKKKEIQNDSSNVNKDKQNIAL